MSEHEGQLHAVLIGIDAYRTQGLAGCVNDVDAVERLLVERAGVPAAYVQRLASPGASRPPGPPGPPGAPRRAGRPEVPATLANIRAALAALAARVQGGDDVLFYYSGHGVRVPLSAGGYVMYREALVPIDAEDEPEDRLLYDHELNGALARLAATARSVTCVLDCCHAAGATRGGAHARTLNPSRALRWWPPPPAPAPSVYGGAELGHAAPWPAGCLVVSACLDFEIAMETTSRDGVCHGILTRAWLRALAGLPDDELWTARWSQIWHVMRAEVEAARAQQHIWMSGSPARRILGGPPAGGDVGLPLRRVAGGGYEIDAGSLESVTEDALVAVYGPDPDWFPPLDSAEDRAARAGLLRVTAARLGAARAVAAGAPFELPPGARGRVVEAGRAARLRCALEPFDEELAAAVRGSPLLELADPAGAHARLIQTTRGWLLVDEAYEGTWSTALALLPRPDRVRARAALEHYHAYSLPLRLAEAVLGLHDAVGLRDALDLRVLACERPLRPQQAQTGEGLREAPARGRGEYELAVGAGVCIRVHNRSRKQLRVALLNVAASGKVQLLGEGPLDADSAQIVWCLGKLGAPYYMTLPPEKRAGIDRLVAIGTTDLDRNLGYLQVNRRFSDVLEATRGAPATRGADGADGADDADDEQTRKDLLFRPPGARWTTARAIVRTRAAPARDGGDDRDDSRDAVE